MRPGQFLVEVNTQLLERVHHLNVRALDVRRCVGCGCPAGVKDEVVFLISFITYYLVLNYRIYKLEYLMVESGPG